MASGDKSIFSREIQAFADQAQELEDATYDVATKRGVDTATGAVLDLVGEIVGQTRPVGIGDSDYRDLIRFKIQMNSSGGEPERLVLAVQVLTGATEIFIVEGYCSVWIYFSATSFPANIFSMLYKLKAAGVKLFLTNGEDTPFMLDSSTNGLDQGKLTQKLS
jgi:hypothetical protein